MNTYKVRVKGTDPIGHEWLKNVVEVANMGGVIAEQFTVRTTFPHECTMLVSTEEDVRLETDMQKGIVVYPVMVAKTREELEAMEWEDFKKECREWGIGGRHRETMTNQYMRAVEQADCIQVVEEAEVKPKANKSAKQPADKQSPEKKAESKQPDTPVQKKEEEVVEKE